MDEGDCFFGFLEDFVGIAEFMQASSISLSSSSESSSMSFSGSLDNLDKS
uniref:Uncharacterized protein n=1 Tax=Anguilla anguilla TaxID=7936 RepID=A0A0E9PU10_ANGAN